MTHLFHFLYLHNSKYYVFNIHFFVTVNHYGNICDSFKDFFLERRSFENEFQQPPQRETTETTIIDKYKHEFGFQQFDDVQVQSDSENQFHVLDGC